MFSATIMLKLLAFPFIVSFQLVAGQDISAIDLGIFNTIDLYQQYAQAAKCPANTDDRFLGGKVVCNNCPNVTSSTDTEIVEKFANQDISDITGYVAVDRTHKLLVVGIRGTDNVANWIEGILAANLLPLRASYCPGCLASHIFFDEWQSVANIVKNAVSTTIAARKVSKDFRVLAVGHSLGGALATFAGLELRNLNLGFQVDIASYGAPRIGNAELSEEVSRQEPRQGKNYRVTHERDPIPAIPWKNLTYRHITPAYHIMTPTGVRPSARDVTRVDNPDVDYPFTGDFDAHGYYIRPFIACP